MILFTVVVCILCEVMLCYVNYLARFKFRDTFREETGVWAWMDAKNLTVPSLIIHACIIAGFQLFAYALDFVYFSAITLGIVMTNLVFDYATVKRGIVCMDKCDKTAVQGMPISEVRKVCIACGLPKEYEVTIFPKIKVKRKKHVRD